MTRSLESKWNSHEGYVMRSYAEARVAEFMTRAGIFWVYEHMPYDFWGYLPDFYLPNLDAFVEVKGTAATPEEVEKCERLQRETGCIVFLSEGSPSQAGWQPRVLLDGDWRPVPMARIRQGVVRFAGQEAVARFLSAFNVSHIGAPGAYLVGPMCDALRVSIHHELDSKSRAIYLHNAPVTQERLQENASAKPSAAESLCIDFLNSRDAGGDA